jgi:penicillin-binding protein 1C
MKNSGNPEKDISPIARFRRLIENLGVHIDNDYTQGEPQDTELLSMDETNKGPIDSFESGQEQQTEDSLDDTLPVKISIESDSTTVHGASPKVEARFNIENGQKEYSRREISSSTIDTSDNKTPALSRTNKIQTKSSQKKVERKRIASKSNKRSGWRSGLMGCLIRLSLFLLFLLIILGLCSVSFGLIQYYQIASTLPDISDLRESASKFETTRILDRNGNILYEILDPNAGRRTYVPLERISPFLVAATVATEDKGFYTHPGFDPAAILRAFIQNYQGGETVSGASTITQQLARTLLFSPEERYEQSYSRKIREAVLATEITRRYTKDEILELYLNEIYYGNLAYGVQAASETYFNTTADKLTLGQAAFLAGLPQAPAVYDVYTNSEAAFSRMEDVLLLMYQTSQEQGCIYVSNNSQRICLNPVDVTEAVVEVRNFEFESPDIKIRSPHWVNYIRSLLEEQYDPQTIYRSGFSVYTTLDPDLQNRAENIIQEHLEDLKKNNANDAALVAIIPSSGEILAMVGSSDFFSEDISGQVNMAISPRQPGSAIKPITYLGAFEKGWTPATLLWDVPSEFPPSGSENDQRPAYKPVNYDGRFHGPITVRSALANSYNVPAVKALDFIGIYDDPSTQWEDGFVAIAKRLGITTLTQDDYGLSLTLGGGEVTLLELTNAFASFANNGRFIQPVAITKILDYDGNLVFEHKQSPGVQVMRPEHAFLISSILSDNKARSPAMGSDSVLNLPFPAAVKTGTTNDFRDSLTVGYTPDLSVGIWVGNADYTPMINISGLRGAAPIWAQFMRLTIPEISGDNPSTFTRPGGIVEREICKLTGAEPSDWCNNKTIEYFAADQPPLSKSQDLWQEMLIDTWTGLKASAACSEYTEEKFLLNVEDPWARKWLRNSPQGENWLEENGFEGKIDFSPDRECNEDDPQPIIEFTSPEKHETITSNPLRIYGIADASDWFKSVKLEFGMGEEPEDWETLAKGNEQINRSELLYTWDLSDIQEGLVTLRLYIESIEGTYAEERLPINLNVPTPTPTPTFTPTSTSTPTMTPSPTATPIPTKTNTPLPSDTPSNTSTATLTPENTSEPIETQAASSQSGWNPFELFQQIQESLFGTGLP